MPLLPLLGAVVGCHGRVPLLGSRVGCHGRVPLLGAMVGCHGRVPLERSPLDLLCSDHVV